MRDMDIVLAPRLLIPVPEKVEEVLLLRAKDKDLVAGVHIIITVVILEEHQSVQIVVMLAGVVGKVISV